MDKTLIITSKCFKDARADGSCGRNLKEAFEDQENIFLLGYTSIHESEELDNNNEVCFFYKKDKKNNHRLSMLSKLVKPVLDKELCNKYFENACKIIENEGIKVVVGVYFPLETLVTIRKLKKKYPYITTISYEVDSAINLSKYSSRLGYYHIRSYERYLRSVYSCMDYILVMKCHYNNFVNKFPSYSNKTYEIDSPVLLDYSKLNKKVIKDTIDFYYTGYLDKDYYSPDPILSMFDLNRDKTNWRIHLYTRGNCEKIIADASLYDNRIKQHGYIPEKELNNELGKADFFISIDNSLKPNSIPSKAFKFFGMCKPVIHFAHNDSYFAKYYMNDYELGLVVSNIHKENEMLCEYINNMKDHRSINYSSVRNKFIMNTPEYSASLIKKLVDNTNNG